MFWDIFASERKPLVSRACGTGLGWGIPVCSVPLVGQRTDRKRQFLYDGSVYRCVRGAASGVVWRNCKSQRLCFSDYVNCSDYRVDDQLWYDRFGHGEQNFLCERLEGLWKCFRAGEGKGKCKQCGVFLPDGGDGAENEKWCGVVRLLLCNTVFFADEHQCQSYLSGSWNGRWKEFLLYQRRVAFDLFHAFLKICDRGQCNGGKPAAYPCGVIREHVFIWK